MNAQQEREQFTERLKASLYDAKYPNDSPISLQREFNVRYAGKAVTVHSVRKWLIAESIPTQDKMMALAKWLCVSAEWLRYGVGMAETGAAPGERYESEDLRLISDLNRLDDKHKKIAREFLSMLVKLNKG